jgi:hypothetical protein
VALLVLIQRRYKHLQQAHTDKQASEQLQDRGAWLRICRGCELPTLIRVYCSCLYPAQLCTRPHGVQCMDRT